MEEAESFWSPSPFAATNSTSIWAEIATATKSQYNERQKIQRVMKVCERVRIERAGFYPPPNWPPNLPSAQPRFPLVKAHHDGILTPLLSVKLRRLKLMMTSQRLYQYYHSSMCAINFSVAELSL